MTSYESMYFEWLCSKVGAGYLYDYQQRRGVLTFLFKKPFWYHNLMDKNRAEDAENMREAFQNSHQLYFDHITSCLEVMIALCIRMGKDIMGTDDPNELSRWFVDMLRNLELYSMTDDNFDPEQADILVDLWISGGLTLFDCPDELKDYDIWYQMQYYLNNILERG